MQMQILSIFPTQPSNTLSEAREKECALLGLQVLHPLPGICVPRTRWSWHSKLIFWTKTFCHLWGKQSQRKRLQEVVQLVFLLRRKRVKKEQLQFTWGILTDQLLQPQKEVHYNTPGYRAVDIAKLIMRIWWGNKSLVTLNSTCRNRNKALPHDAGSQGINVVIMMLWHPGTTLWNDNTGLPREVCSQRTPIFGTALLQEASNHKYGDNVWHRGPNKIQTKLPELQIKMRRASLGALVCFYYTKLLACGDIDYIFMGRRRKTVELLYNSKQLFNL